MAVFHFYMDRVLVALPMMRNRMTGLVVVVLPATHSLEMVLAVAVELVFALAMELMAPNVLVVVCNNLHSNWSAWVRKLVLMMLEQAEAPSVVLRD